MGNLSLSSSSQQRTIIQNVLHVPHLSANLLSISRITKQGYGVYFDNSNMEAVDVNNL